MLRHIEIESWEERWNLAVLLWFQSKVHLWHKVRKWCERSERLFFKFLLYPNSRFLKRDYALVIDLSSDNYQFLPYFDFLVETRGALFQLPLSRRTISTIFAPFARKMIKINLPCELEATMFEYYGTDNSHVLQLEKFMRSWWNH